MYPRPAAAAVLGRCEAGAGRHVNIRTQDCVRHLDDNILAIIKTVKLEEK